MGVLQIKTIRDITEEAEPRYICIDTFENIYTGYNYYFGCEVFGYTYNNDGKMIRNERKEITGHFRDDFDCIEACNDDIAENPDITMYLALSEALKKKGYIFNKKKCRFQKVKNEQPL